ncbi:MAG TPA: VPLPA-CTERM sorting domain-containing protein [Steroidobacteraceae bacterium]|nr:VPLPA-CTERM sorting domain-containing protein [Steroidobacteraceae bacterium]
MNAKGIRTLLAGAALSVIGSATVVQAQNAPLPFAPVLQIGSTDLVGGTVTANTDGSFTLVGQQQGGSFNGGAVWDLAWDLTLNQDPSIAGTLTLTNLTTTTRNFNLQFVLPVTPTFSPSVFGGSITATATDANNNSVLELAPIAVSPSIYRGQIDGSTVLSLFAANLTCLASGPGCVASGTESDGLPGPTNPGPGVASSIALLLNFSLTPGDRVVFDTNFTVEPPTPVPLPAALPLMLLGVGALGGLRRRREA